ncbi:uncharacterized protein LOC131008198 [Salvia miltiorrhiza]|uniref:uncharacterized protein LOC131008198 n=1 Tax=Salvia miltiorrhiza TaxID=226208 RepID=UPI0025AB9D13|nr:uncharacterized protein LOC131008198 [Salvia miltiorrhiza]
MVADDAESSKDTTESSEFDSDSSDDEKSGEGSTYEADELDQLMTDHCQLRKMFKNHLKQNQIMPGVATFLYGAAHGEGRSLDTIRRELGYFKRNADGNQWVGSLQSETLQPKPDEGPPRDVSRKGVVVVGATQWVKNYNVPIFSTDMAVVRRIAKRISGRGGGLPSVQSMALAHGKGMIEVDCNQLDTSKAGGEDVQRAVECLAREEGMDVGEGYYTDLSQNQKKFICFFDVVYGDVEAGLGGGPCGGSGGSGLELRGTREARGRR